jgi:hypothetical protein
LINIEVYSTHAVIRSQQPLTVGLTGASAHFAFGKPWDQLIKTAVFRQGEKTLTVADIGQQVELPWEVLTLPGVPVMIGVYGTDPEGKLVIPTLWAETEPVRPGADPQDGVTPADPTAPVWAQLQSNMGSREQLQTNDKTSLVAAINEANRAVCWVKVSRKEDGAYYIDGTNVPALLNAFSDGKTLICDLSGALMPLTGYSSTGLFEFTSIRNNTKYCVTILPDGTVTYTNTVLATNQSKLPNPQKLTFIGNATAEYDGSEAVTVGIPTKVSQLQNDSGFLTEVLAPLYLVTINDANKAEQSYDDRMAAYQSGYVIQCDYLGTRLPLKAVVDMDFMFSGTIDRTSYHVVVRSNGSTVINERSLASQTDIPTKVSDLEDAGDYLTEAPVTSVNGQTGAVAVSTAIKVEVWQKNDGSYDYSHNSLRIMNALSAGNTVFCQLGTHYLLSLVYATPAKCIFTGVYEGELYAVTVTSTGATVTTTPLSSGGGGSDGITPHIGANGNWWIGEEDTGVSAGVTDEQISGAVEAYMKDNPLGGGADGLYFDETTWTLYLMSKGQIIGNGVQLPTTGDGPTNNAVLTLENTTGWSNKTIPNSQPTCTVSFKWSSVEGDVSTGSGTLVVKVAGELRRTAPISQGEHTLNIFDYLTIGYNLVHVTVTDFYGNSQTIPFGVTMYDPAALISTKLVERTLTGDYTNDRVTKVGNGAFTGLTLGRLSLPNVTAVEEKGLGATATEIELQSLPELYYRAFMGGDIDVVKVPSVVKLTHYQALFLDKKINRMIFNCVNLETSGNPLGSTWNKVVTFDFHRLKSLPVIPGGSTRTVIIRTPEVCALQAAPGTTAVNVYVPASLVDSYKLETNWSEMADKIFAIEDYPDICEVSADA